MIAAEISNAVERTTSATGGANQTPSAIATSLTNEISDTTAARSLAIRTSTRAAVSEALFGAVASSIERRAAGGRAQTLSAVGTLLLGKQLITRDADANTDKSAVERSAANGDCAATSVPVCDVVAAVATRRRKGIGEQVVQAVCTQVPRFLGICKAAARNSAVIAINQSVERSSGGGGRKQQQHDVSLLMAELMVTVGSASAATEQRMRAEMLVALESATGTVVSCHAQVGGGGPQLRNQVADLIVQQVGLLAIQRKAGEACRDASAILGADAAGASRVALGQPPEWMQSTRVRTPEYRLPPLTSGGLGVTSPPTIGSPGLGATGAPQDITQDITANIRCELLQVEQMSGRYREIPVKPAASLLSGTRHVPHSRISPFTGFYKSWQYELQDSPNKFDKRRQFEHLHSAVKYCSVRKPLPIIPKEVPPWEEDGADMSLQKVKAPAVKKSPGKTWDASKVHGMTDAKPIDKKPLPVLGMQQHGRELSERGM